MVAKRIKSEYMKKFKEPKWDTFFSCYLDMVHYRNMRRLLEQAHNPWLWDGWQDSSTSSSGDSTPKMQEKEEEEVCVALTGALPVPQPPTQPRPEPVQSAREIRQPEPPQPEPLQPEPPRPEQPQPKPSEKEPPAPEGASVRGNCLKRDLTPPPCSSEKILEADQKGKNLKQIKPKTKNTSVVQPILDGLCAIKKASQSRGLKKSPRTALLAAAQDTVKKTKPPFALYGWGGKDGEVGCQKTYNINALTSREIYDSAVRAKNRRQVEKKMRARSGERQCKCPPRRPEPPAKTPSRPQEPWVSEYMRCYSAWS
uniref:Centriole, cilia and spindle-associated protein b n=1 Tax=Callorhinchus milii TaxID=7868 RepID=A0A4W3HNK9_CALMI|eukprot:gi/632953855/ref/XP_007892650.1/ PREDICTED: centriole, cilia and spindle-associated protein [Callorhinchus milii]